jgi:soluble lytic murein transglycosylase-like protein
MFSKVFLSLILCLQAVAGYTESLTAGGCPEPGLLALSVAELAPGFSLDDLQPQSDMDATPVEATFAYSKFVLPTAAKYGVDWRLVVAVIKAESSFNARARSSRGAVGLMQVMPRTAALYQVKKSELWDPARNLEAGVRHLRMLQDRYDGDLSRTLAAYNSGENAVARYHGVPPYRDTRAFVKKVLQHYSSPEMAALSNQGGFSSESKGR